MKLGDKLNCSYAWLKYNDITATLLQRFVNSLEISGEFVEA